MDNEVSKLLYIGAGTDAMPLLDFKHVDEFIFIDTQPRSKNDLKNEVNLDDYVVNFMLELEGSYSIANFFLDSYTIIDPFYHYKLFNLSQLIYCAFYKIPVINPALLIFTPFLI